MRRNIPVEIKKSPKVNWDVVKELKISCEPKKREKREADDEIYDMLI